MAKSALGALVLKFVADTKDLRKGIRQSRRNIKKFADGMKRRLKKAALVGAAGLAAGATAAIKFGKSVIDAADRSEQLRLRLNALLGSTEEGARAFELMSEFAAGVPFEFENIMKGATQLAGVVEGGADEIAELMPMIADLSAVSGLSIDKTTDQIVRSFSAGIGAADLFRDRGITAMLGFQSKAGASAEETRRRIIAEWKKTDSQFRGAANGMANTWKGLMSMFSDRWFQFKNQVADSQFFDTVKRVADDLLSKIDEMSESGELERLASEVGRILTGGVERGIQAIGRFGNALIDTIAFFRDNPLVGDFGIVGLVFFGPKGGAVGAALGKVMGEAAKELGLIAKTAMEEQREHLQNLRDERDRLLSNLEVDERFRRMSTEEIDRRLEQLDQHIRNTEATIRRMESGDEPFGQLRTGAERAEAQARSLFDTMEGFEFTEIFGGEAESVDLSRFVSLPIDRVERAMAQAMEVLQHENLIPPELTAPREAIPIESRQVRVRNALADATDRWRDAQQRVNSIIRSGMTETQRIREQIQQLKVEFDAGTISAEKFHAAMGVLQSQLADAAEQQGESFSQKFAERLKQGGKHAISSLVEGMLRGTRDTGDLIKGIGLRIASMLLSQGLFSALNIASPSGKGIFVGRMLGLGIVEGMESTISLVRGASDRLAMAAMPQMGSARMQLAGAGAQVTPGAGRIQGPLVDFSGGNALTRFAVARDPDVQMMRDDVERVARQRGG